MDQVECPRFIPAPAGNRVWILKKFYRSSVHPRACGEQATTAIFTGPATGSSPRLRGTAIWTGSCPCQPRFIPAPAGNSGNPPANAASLPVHPRACGEQVRADSNENGKLGSSPRLRGTGPPLMVVSIVTRFIPAPAGNSEQVEVGHFLGRFIPAPAGNRTPQHPRNNAPTVHPRACGEQITTMLSRRPPNGSSPRLRGTVRYSGIRRLCPRFIPAPAGNRSSPAESHLTYPVHPRACGEQPQTLTAVPTSTGSSPRLRGTVGAGHDFQFVLRFIPAPAGNS